MAIWVISSWVCSDWYLKVRTGAEVVSNFCIDSITCIHKPLVPLTAEINSSVAEWSLWKLLYHAAVVVWNRRWMKIATWLILPVVIRSSQRLSHACLSINLVLWNCERLIISVIVYLIVPYYLDIRSNSRVNTCFHTLYWVAFIRWKPTPSGWCGES